MNEEELKDKLNYLEDLYYRESSFHFYKQQNGFGNFEYESEYLEDLQKEIRSIKITLGYLLYR